MNIDELIIRGVAPGDRQRILGEVQEELHRLLMENGMPSQPGLSGGQPPVATPKPREGGGDSLARQIARGVYQKL